MNEQLNPKRERDYSQYSSADLATVLDIHETGVRRNRTAAEEMRAELKAVTELIETRQRHIALIRAEIERRAPQR